MAGEIGSTETSGLTQRKIALVGSAPSSVLLAPYQDPTWEIWGCSPGAATAVKRVDAWFEIHPLSDEQVFTPDYIEWLGKVDKPVYTTALDRRVPSAIPYPKDEMVAKYGRYFFTSSLAWMLALAIEQRPAMIGFWGVDMSAVSEYGQQRPGCHHFITIAVQHGIQVVTPAESDLLRPPMLYGFSTESPMYQKMRIRQHELTQRTTLAATAYEAARNKLFTLNGGIEQLEHVLSTLSKDADAFVELVKRRDQLVRQRDAAQVESDEERNRWNFMNGAMDDLKYTMATWID